jgi:hypothetical protein
MKKNTYFCKVYSLNQTNKSNEKDNHDGSAARWQYEYCNSTESESEAC